MPGFVPFFMYNLELTLPHHHTLTRSGVPYAIRERSGDAYCR